MTTPDLLETPRRRSWLRTALASAPRPGEGRRVPSRPTPAPRATGLPRSVKLLALGGALTAWLGADVVIGAGTSLAATAGTFVAALPELLPAFVEGFRGYEPPR